MSDREPSPTHSGSHQSPPPNNKSPSSHHSRSRERSHSHSHSHSPARRSHHRGRSYSRSRSRTPGHSRSRKMSYRSSRYKSRSRSRSPRERRYKSSRYSKSRSRSASPRGRYYGYSDRRREYYRSHSRSPMSNRRRHVGSRVIVHRRNKLGEIPKDDPSSSRCLGVFGLSLYTTERELHQVFSKYGPLEKVQVIIDAQTGRSRGFAFVYFESLEDAKVAKDQCSGMEIDGRRIRVDYSITQRAHTPTPGIYMGKPTYSNSGYRGGGYRRSPSPYYSRRRNRGFDRSRSRSYSPRFEERGIG